jgi:transposase
MPTTCWGVTRRAWLGRQVFEPPGRQQAFDDYRFCVDQIDRRIGALEGEIARLAVDGPHAAPIGRLRCLRGNDTLTAIGPVCEVGDFARFATAEQFMSFVGPVPSERSSGDAHRHRNQDPAVLAARAAAASSACTAAGNGWPAAASPTRRSSSPAPASAPDTSGRSPPTSRRARPSNEHQSSVA